MNNNHRTTVQNARHDSNSRLQYNYPSAYVRPIRINWDATSDAKSPSEDGAALMDTPAPTQATLVHQAAGGPNAEPTSDIDGTNQEPIDTPSTGNDILDTHLVDGGETEAAPKYTWAAHRRAYLDEAFTSIVHILENEPDALDYQEDFKPLLDELRRVKEFVLNRTDDPHKEDVQPLCLPLFRIVRIMVSGNGESYDPNADYDHEDIFEVGEASAQNEPETWGVVRMPSGRLHESKRYRYREPGQEDDEHGYPHMIAFLTALPLLSLVAWARFNVNN